MPTINWNEIRFRASNFVNEWKDSQGVKEKAEAQTFETEFLKIFGVDRKKVALFEHEVRFSDGQADFFEQSGSGEIGYIDLFWKGYIIIEMKTPGKDLDKAYVQAKKYALALPQKEIPKGILTCDFLNFKYYDLENVTEGVPVCHSFRLDELPERVELFGYLAGYKDIKFEAVSAVDIEAAEHMGELHDALKDSKYTGHQLEMYLVRLLFCLFADDSGIFDEKKLFYNYIKDNTKEDGSDLALYLGQIFDILNKHEDKRLDNIDETLDKFPYVNGGLFEERLETAAFTSTMRKTLLKCCKLDWSKIKPEIFGAMFQSVKDKESRRKLGEHYTSETNILKVIKPLFLDTLKEEFEKIRKLKSDIRTHRLLEFHTKLRQLKFLDPACGCGNFLVVSYRELRQLEIEVLSEYLHTQQVFDIELMIRVNVDQFFGIETEEFPARIAQTALWLMDHLMNKKVEQRFGKYKPRIPLTASPTIVIGNALTIDWENVVSKDELSYILGNPPFVGLSLRTTEQQNDMGIVFTDNDRAGRLDYVSAWYKKAANFIKDTLIETAFVSTNSITQGEQAPILWEDLLNKSKVFINFAYRSFVWSNEAKGKAAVHCVIIGFSKNERKHKQLFEYNDEGTLLEFEAKRINGYLIDADNVFIKLRGKPNDKLPILKQGSKPWDGGFLLLSESEKEILVNKYPQSQAFIKRYIGSEEFINNGIRYCLWLLDVEPSAYRNIPDIMERLEGVRKIRKETKTLAVNKQADTPALFSQIRQPKTNYLLVPETSSENRNYIPIGFLPPENIASNATLVAENATLYHFGILTSIMHMAWTRTVCGRLEMRYRYSPSVYNNFPFPNPTDKQRTEIEKLAQTVLDTRLLSPNSSLADLYDPLTMPKELLKAHQKLDKAVETAYGKIFDTDSQRVAYLFELYQKNLGELEFTDKKKSGKGKKNK